MTLKVIGGALYQWDTGRSLEISPGEGLKVGETLKRERRQYGT